MDDVLKVALQRLPKPITVEEEAAAVAAAAAANEQSRADCPLIGQSAGTDYIC